MDPYGRHHHHHNRRDERDEEDYPPPQPPPSYEDYPPPPPQSTHVHHSSHHSGGGPEYPHPPPSRVPDYYDPRRPEQPPPPPFQDFNSYAPPPPHVQHVQHVSHSSSSYGRDEVNEEEPHHFRPHMPSFISDHIHHQGGSDLGGKTSVRVFSKADTNYSLTIRDGKVILVRSDPSDPCQHWIKDEKFSIRVKDEQGFPSFALVNKATGQAIKHSIGATHPVQLIPYNPDVLDESVLWTESKDLGDGYRTIRMVNNIRLNFDAFDGNKNRGGVHDGTIIVLWEWGKKENQRWNIVPYCVLESYDSVCVS